MAYQGKSTDYSGDERDSRSGGEERLEGDLHDKPIYLLEHLATFTVNKDSGIVYPADGMRRLLQLEKTTGIWSQKMQLCLDYPWILIIDFETGNIIERFPASLIQEPTAFTSTDAMELYNNILVFIVSGGSGSRSEMHIFQSLSVSAVHLVEDLKSLRTGKAVAQQREIMHNANENNRSKPPPPISGGFMQPSPTNVRAQEQHQQQQQYHHSHRSINMDQYGIRGGGGAMIAAAEVAHHGHHHQQHHHQGHHHDGDGGITETESELGGPNDETSSTSSDKYERDVAVLNHCFDDIEKFIARLQHAAAASRELERRRRNRKTKKKDPGEGLLTLRTRPPHEKEFVDIFAKFKLSFNLLAKLKAHIHDPNAPELVHFLFTPLALIVEAASDTYYEAQLPARVVNPLLTREAVNLLINCVTSKETELWRSLGDAWIVPRDQWKEDVGSYHPVFMDGWSPDYLVIDELEPSTSPNIRKRRLEIGPHHGAAITGGGSMMSNLQSPGANVNYDDYDNGAVNLNEKYIIHRGHSPQERSDRPGGVGGVGGGGVGGVGDFGTRSEISIDSIERSGPVDVGSTGPNANAMQSITTGIQNLYSRESRGHAVAAGGVGGVGVSGGGGVVGAYGGELIRAGGGVAANDDKLLDVWLDDLQAAGAKIVLVTYPRTANNDKELSVVRGEYLEILDDTRKWWKARNMRGQIAHVPHTIVTPFNYGDNHQSGNQFYGQQNNYKSRSTPIHPNKNDELNDSTDWIQSKHVGKKGEFRYF